MIKFIIDSLDRRGILLLSSTIILFSLTIGARVGAPIIFRYVVDYAFIQKIVIFLLLGYAVSFFVARFLEELRLVIYIMFEQAVQKIVILKVLLYFYRIPFKIIVAGRSAEYTSIIDRGIAGLRGAMHLTLFDILPTTIEIGFFVMIFFLYSDLASASSILVLFIIFLCITLLLSKKIQAHQEGWFRIASRNFAIMTESVAYSELLRAYSGIDWTSKRIAGRQDLFIKAVRATLPSILSLGTLQGALLTIIVGFVTWISIGNYGAGSWTIGDVVMINGLLLQMIIPLQQFAGAYKIFIGHIASFRQLHELCKQADGPIIPPKNTHQNEDVAARLSGISILFGERSALKSVSIEIHERSFVLINGASGSGKTLLGRVVAGLLEHSGTVTYRSGIRSIGYMSQSVEVFDVDLASNVALGRPVDNARLASCLQQAGFGSDELALIGDRDLGENGKALSGGQRQRLGLARMLYHDADILVLDEPTSALDPLTAGMVKDTIFNLAKQRTVVMISHDPNDELRAHHIYTMEAGALIRIVDTRLNKGPNSPCP